MRRVAVRSFREARLLAGRNLRHIPRVPEQLMDATVQPLIFILLFAYVFGSSIDVGTGASDYREYLISGMFGQALIGVLAGIAVGVTADVEKGFMDRMRTLPISRVAVLLGRAMAEVAKMLLGITVTTVIGLAIGWAPHGSVLDTLAAYGLLLAFASSGIWVGILLGLVSRSVEAAQTYSFTTIIPLLFVSATYVPVGDMPTPLRQIAEWNPLSAIATAMRDLFGSPLPNLTDAWPMQHPVLATLGWSVVLTLIAVPLAVRRYRRLGSA